jgi:SAM-dependent methyltransferase
MRLPPRLRPIRDRLWPARDHGTVFSRIHREGAWGDGEAASGPGSTAARGAQFRDALVARLRQLEVRVLLDAPCGTFAWTGPVADAVERYVGLDVVPAIIEANRLRHGGAGRDFVLADITRDALPASDAILCRDALVHFSTADVWAALARFRASGARYLVTTSTAP